MVGLARGSFPDEELSRNFQPRDTETDAPTEMKPPLLAAVSTHTRPDDERRVTCSN